MTKKNRTAKIILSFLIVLIIAPTVLFSQPKTVRAFWPTWDVVNGFFQGSTAVSSSASAGTSGLVAIYDSQDLLIDIQRVGKEILRQVLIALGHQLLNQLTQSTVNWINSGFHGAPLFVQNPESFFGGIEQTAIKNVVNTVGYDPLQPFGKSFALNMINQYRASSTKDTQYTLSQVTTNPTTLNNYQTNFNSGGWNAFLINTQYPQNNYLGYNMQMSNITYEQTTANSKKSSVPTLAQKAQTILSQGSGFLSPSKCPTNINASYNTMTNEFNPPTFTPDTSTLPKIPDCIPNTVEQQNLDGSSTAVTAAGCQNQSLIDQAKAQYTTVLSNEQSAFNMTTGCVDPKTGKSALVATTPGAVVGSQITNALASNGHATELDAALGNSISVILNALMNHFLQKGLSEISSVVQSAPSIDTWNYNGLSLTGNNTTGANTTGGIIVPTNVSLAVGSTSPQPISGGTAPYTATSNFPDTATVKISGSTISVTGVSQGTALITITDSSSPVKVAVIAATVGGQNGNMMLNFTNTTTNPTSVSVGTGNSVTLTLSGGTQPYSIQTQPNSNIAITQITNSNSLLIAGLAAGNTSVSLEDSAGQTVNLSIAVGTESPLVATPTTVSVTGNGSASSTISGGTPPYSIVTQPTSGTASAFLSGNTLNVTGASTGNTSVTVQDSYSPAETITIPITATAVPSVSPTGSPQNVSVQAGSSTTVNIITSDPTVLPVILTPPTAAIATAQIQNSSILSITGVSAGITSLVIQTSSSNTSAGSTNNVVGNGTTSTTTSSPTTITISITVTPIAGTNTTF